MHSHVIVLPLGHVTVCLCHGSALDTMSQPAGARSHAWRVPAQARTTRTTAGCKAALTDTVQGLESPTAPAMRNIWRSLFDIWLYHGTRDARAPVVRGLKRSRSAPCCCRRRRHVRATHTIGCFKASSQAWVCRVASCEGLVRRRRRSLCHRPCTRVHVAHVLCRGRTCTRTWRSGGAHRR